MLQQRLRVVKKLDLKLAGKLGAGGSRDERRKVRERQSINTGEAISIYNICGELKAFGTSENDFGFIHREGKKGEEHAVTGGADHDNEDMGNELLEAGGDGFTDNYDDSDEDEEERGGSDDDEEDGEVEGLGAARNYVQTIDCVELVWNGICQRVYFTLPTEWRSLSERKQKEFLDSVDCTSAESRMKELIDRSDDMLELMKHYAKLKNQSALFSAVNENFMACRCVDEVARERSEHLTLTSSRTL